MIFLGMVGGGLVPFSLTSGRMRYAPTLVRLISWVCWIGDGLRFRSFQGVCDTPLHLFDDILGCVGLQVGFVFALFRAYAIRPYTCSIDFLGMVGWGLIPFSLI